MNCKKFFAGVLVCVLSVVWLSTTVMAVGTSAKEEISLKNMEKSYFHLFSIESEGDSFSPYALGTINTTISPNSIVAVREQLPMGAYETVTINCSFNPASASLDFGLIDSDNVFHYINVTGGSINETIHIDERGDYTFAIRNKSSVSVSVVGFLNY